MHFSGSRALLRKAWRLQYGIKPQPRSDSSTAQRTPASSHNQATSRAFPSTFPKVSQPLRRTITKPSSSGKLQTKCRCALPNYFGGNSMATMSTMSSHTIEPADPPLHRQPLGDHLALLANRSALSSGICHGHKGAGHKHSSDHTAN